MNRYSVLREVAGPAGGVTAPRFASILDTVGNTPVVQIRRLAPPGVDLYAKIEAFNPMGSVKDRMAHNVIETAERSGALKPGQTVVEATSGNTGIGLAMVCAAKGYPLVVTMAENFSVERRRILRFLGARVVLTPAALKGSGMVAKARELADAHGWFLVRQFENEANADAHSFTTAAEILDAFADSKLDYFVTGYGTGGTLKGTARTLKECSPATRIVVCEPDNAALLASGEAQDRNEDGSPANSHSAFRPHLMQGWTPDFIPKLAQDALDSGLVDDTIGVSGEEALRGARELARREGIFAGISGGATFAAALKVATYAAPGSRILFMLPDTGERYLSTPLFDDIPVEMTEEETEIARSTPNFRFDSPVGGQPAENGAPPGGADPETARFLDETLSDPESPVVLFALQWCEFAWAVRKLFRAAGIGYRHVALDSVALQQGERGSRVRAALSARTGIPTIPQVFVGGELVGGCTEVFAAYRDGRLRALLARHGIEIAEDRVEEPSRFLPGWLHTR
jgi:cysteine synthase A